MWSWAITAPFAITVMSGVQYVSRSEPMVATLAVAVVQHVGVGVLLLAGWCVLRVTPRAARVVTVLALFAIIGALRPLLFLASGSLLQLAVTPGDLPARMGINVVTSVAMFALIAIGVDLVSEHLGVVRRLRAAQSALERDATWAAERVRRLRHSSVDTVLRRIDERAAAVADGGVRPAEAAAMLRALADEVVRPVSHRVFAGPEAGADEGDAAAGTNAAEHAEIAAVAPRLRDLAAALLAGMRPAPAIATAVLFAVLAAPFALARYGLLIAATQVVLGFAVLAAGNAAVSWAVAQIGRTGFRLVTLIGGYIMVGLALTVESGVYLRSLGQRPDLVGFQALLYPVIAVCVAFVASMSARLRADQSALQEALQVSVRSAARLRADYDHERAGIVRILHSGVQSELIAAALVLEAEDRADAAAVMRQVLDGIRRELQTPGPPTDPESRIRSLVESWGSALMLDARIDDAVWERLRDPARCAAVVDAISEGLANAVRHGDGGRVSLAVRAEESQGVQVSVTSSGSLQAARPGIGLRELAQRGEVALRQVGDGVELAVAIP